MLTHLDRLTRRRVDGRAVTATRVMLGVALVMVSLESFVVLAGIADGALAYPFVDWAPRPSTTAANAVLLLGWTAGVCLVLGLLPHVMAGVGAGLGVLTLLWEQQLYSSHLTFLTVMLALLTFSQSDRHRGISRRRHTDALGVPWWPQLLMMTQVSTVYLFAGLSKTQPTFLSGQPLEKWMWADLPQVTYAALAWAAVVTEVILAIALWIRRTRKAAIAVGVLFHLSIITLLDGQNVWLVAFAITTTATYPLFFSRPSLQE